VDHGTLSARSAAERSAARSDTAGPARAAGLAARTPGLPTRTPGLPARSSTAGAATSARLGLGLAHGGEAGGPAVSRSRDELPHDGHSVRAAGVGDRHGLGGG